MPLRIVVVADGPPQAAQTNSGVAAGVLGALRARTDVSVVASMDGRLNGIPRLVALLLTFRPDRTRWRQRLRTGRIAAALRKYSLERKLKAYAGEFDYVLFIRNLHAPSTYPYMAYIDSTVGLAQSGWGPWARAGRDLVEHVMLEREYLRGARRVFTVASYVAEDVVSNVGVADDRVTVIGNGCNVAPIGSLAERKEPPGRSILFVGSEFERKGGDLLLAALPEVRRHLSDVQLVLVGRVPREAAAIEGVCVVGPLRSRKKIVELYDAATVFCLPARFEPYGLVVQEAMARGLPCITSSVGAMSSILDSGRRGVLVDEPNGPALSSAIISLLLQPGRREEVARAALEFVRHEMSWAAVVDRMVSAIDTRKQA